MLRSAGYDPQHVAESHKHISDRAAEGNVALPDGAEEAAAVAPAVGAALLNLLIWLPAFVAIVQIALCAV
eukprot:SAG11_NODE_109_length_16381_cov_48.316546_6_plen_70_part_00